MATPSESFCPFAWKLAFGDCPDWDCGCSIETVGGSQRVANSLTQRGRVEPFGSARRTIPACLHPSAGDLEGELPKLKPSGVRHWTSPMQISPSAESRSVRASSGFASSRINPGRGMPGAHRSATRDTGESPTIAFVIDLPDSINFSDNCHPAVRSVPQH